MPRSAVANMLGSATGSTWLAATNPALPEDVPSPIRPRSITTTSAPRKDSS